MHHVFISSLQRHLHNRKHVLFSVLLHVKVVCVCVCETCRCAAASLSHTSCFYTEVIKLTPTRPLLRIDYYTTFQEIIPSRHIVPLEKCHVRLHLPAARLKLGSTPGFSLKIESKHTALILLCGAAFSCISTQTRVSGSERTVEKNQTVLFLVSLPG